MKQAGRVGEERFRLVVVERCPRVVVELLAAVAVSLLVVAVLLATQLAMRLEPGEPEELRIRRGYSNWSSKVVGCRQIQSYRQAKVRTIAQPAVHGCQRG
jgi:Tfp pilus assembly protein PilO